MIEPKLHLLKVKEELIARDAIIALQFGLGITPEVLDCINVLPSTGGKALAMVNAIMSVALRNQTLLAGELIRADGAALGHLLADHCSKGLPHESRHRAGVNLAAPLQELEDGHFVGGATASEALPVSAEVGFVRFDLPPQGRPTFAFLRQVVTDHLIVVLGTVAVDPEYMSGLHGGHL